jgi:hypothetical protein
LKLLRQCAGSDYYSNILQAPIFCLQEEPDEHGQGKWEGKQEGKSDKHQFLYYKYIKFINIAYTSISILQYLIFVDLS